MFRSTDDQRIAVQDDDGHDGAASAANRNGRTAAWQNQGKYAVLVNKIEFEKFEKFEKFESFCQIRNRSTRWNSVYFLGGSTFRIFRKAFDGIAKVFAETESQFERIGVVC